MPENESDGAFTNHNGNTHQMMLVMTSPVYTKCSYYPNNYDYIIKQSLKKTIMGLKNRFHRKFIETNGKHIARKCANAYALLTVFSWRDIR